MSVTVKKRDKKAGDARPKAPAPTPEHHPLLALRRDVDKLFDDFFSGFSLGPFAKRSFDFGALSRMEPLFGKTGALAIHVDASETDDEYRVDAELPGLEEKDIEVTLSGGELTIKAEKKEKKTKEEKDLHLMERRYGSVHRTFRVPESIDEKRVEATFEKGVLRVTMPKREPAKRETKKIKIRSQ